MGGTRVTFQITKDSKGKSMAVDVLHGAEARREIRAGMGKKKAVTPKTTKVLPKQTSGTNTAVVRQRLVGIVERWDTGRGFGFIKPDGGGNEVLCYIRDIMGDFKQGNRLPKGMRVTYRVILDTGKRKGKMVAVDIRHGAAAEREINARVSKSVAKASAAKPPTAKSLAKTAETAKRPRFTGVIARWDDKRACGSIKPDGNSNNVFFYARHATHFTTKGARKKKGKEVLGKGVRVGYCIGVDSTPGKRKGKPVALEVTPAAREPGQSAGAEPATSKCRQAQQYDALIAIASKTASQTSKSNSLASSSSNGSPRRVCKNAPAANTAEPKRIPRRLTSDIQISLKCPNGTTTMVEVKKSALVGQIYVKMREKVGHSGHVSGQHFLYNAKGTKLPKKSSLASFNIKSNHTLFLKPAPTSESVRRSREGETRNESNLPWIFSSVKGISAREAVLYFDKISGVNYDFHDGPVADKSAAALLRKQEAFCRQNTCLSLSLAKNVSDSVKGKLCQVLRKLEATYERLAKTEVGGHKLAVVLSPWPRGIRLRSRNRNHGSFAVTELDSRKRPTRKPKGSAAPPLPKKGRGVALGKVSMDTRPRHARDGSTDIAQIPAASAPVRIKPAAAPVAVKPTAAPVRIKAATTVSVKAVATPVNVVDQERTPVPAVESATVAGRQPATTVTKLAGPATAAPKVAAVGPPNLPSSEQENVQAMRIEVDNDGGEGADPW